MTDQTVHVGDRVVVRCQELQTLLDMLVERGYQPFGPTVRDGAIVYDTLTSAADLPIGWTDEQAPGLYRLHQRGDGAYFGFAVGPHSWKQFLHPPLLRLLRTVQTDGELQIAAERPELPKLALIGVRACELHAIAIQDTVFLRGPYADPDYQARRDRVFLVAVNCTQASGTCFCVSMQAGPKATGLFDLALTEIVEPDRHYFVVEVGTERGAKIVGGIPHVRASVQEQAAAEQIVEQTAAHMGRTLDTSSLKELLYLNYEHPRWDTVAERCLTCGNCTMVCPTCFCTTIEDGTDLTGKDAERVRRWDSCFTLDFSYVAGGSVRSSAKSRYRQWLTHKLATWIDQFGTSGCVGCGRCITWCPVGIDITEEVRAIRETAHSR
jgi:ferredoxin